jgi:chromate transporter
MPTPDKVSLRYLFLAFLKIGSLSFGGFMALISVIQRQLVEEDKVIANEIILDGISLASILPGAVAVNVVAYVGYFLRGIKGAMVSVVAIVLPSFVLITLVAYIYFRFGSVPAINRFFLGIIPAVCAIIIAVGYEMGRKHLKGIAHWIICVVAACLLIFVGGFYITLLIVLGGGIAGAILFRSRNTGLAKRPSFRGLVPYRQVARFAAVIAITGLILVLTWRLLPPEARQRVRLPLRIVVLLSGLSISQFGGAYVMVPTMKALFVEQLHWLSTAEFVDGIAMGQITPGPILISAAFFGYKMYGVCGAALGTVAIFLPPAALTVLCTHFLLFFKESAAVKAVLGGLRPAVIGMILAAAVTLGLPLAFQWRPMLVFLLVLIVSIKLKWNAVYLIPASGVLGWILYLI